MPIITANIHGQDGIQKRAHVLYDKGAQVSLIRNDTALTLGLKGKDTSVTIMKVGGDEEFMQTKVYLVPAESLDDGRRYSIKAIGIPSINEEVTAVQMSQITELLGLKNEKLRRGEGQVDLLIGIGHAHMHTGESKQAGQLVTRSIPLGWVVFGGSSGEMLEISRILHVKFEMPVDLTDFWKT